MASYRRVHDSHHLQADCQKPRSTPGPYALYGLPLSFFSFRNIYAPQRHIASTIFTASSGLVESFAVGRELTFKGLQSYEGFRSRGQVTPTLSALPSRETEVVYFGLLCILRVSSF